MKTRRWPVFFISLSIVTAVGFAGDQKDKKPASAQVDEKAMMEAWMKAATPGEAHKKLEPFVGTFEARVKMWNAPGQPPEESTGVSEATWALGGRWVEQRYTGEAMGQPFHGIGYTGYDNLKHRYVSLWMDDMSTAPMISTGTGVSGNAMTMESTMDDPMSGKQTPIKETITLVDNDHHTFEMWTPGPDGKMFRMMEIQYARRK